MLLVVLYNYVSQHIMVHMYFCIYAFIQYLLRETTEITLVQNLRRKFREMLQLNTIRSILKVEVAKENHCNNNLSALRICIIINLLLVFVAVSSAANNAPILILFPTLHSLHYPFFTTYSFCNSKLCWLLLRSSPSSHDQQRVIKIMHFFHCYSPQFQLLLDCIAINDHHSSHKHVHGCSQITMHS